ncbi:hypothetical protein ACFW5V_32235 [Streptomyces sp. NPDC058762]|uniref:hypothetical protein n=1 Tax=Streptomyces sp. NPDC058762 TaxID=3346629 RepID=UPI0036CF1391
MSDSFAVTAGPLIERIRWARAIGDHRTEHRALEELLTLYVRLGNREVGTLKEQNEYIVARHLGYIPDALQELGVGPADLPEPPGRRPSPPPADPARIAEHLAHVGSPGNDEPRDRYVVRYRPEDNKRYKGRLCPWTVVDRDDGKPVAWYFDQDFAEMTAEEASRLRHTG